MKVKTEIFFSTHIFRFKPN